MSTWLSAGLLSTLVAALGLLATALFRLDGKIDALSAGMNSRFDILDSRLGNRIDAVNGRIDGLVAGMHAGFAGLRQDVAALDRRLAKVER